MPTSEPSVTATVAPTSAATATAAATPIPLPTYTQLSAPSRNVVWALVGGTRLFRSTDSGDTWEERPFGGPSFRGGNDQISFIDATRGWIATPGSPATQCQFQSVGLARTIDAGDVWTSLFEARPPTEPDASGLGGGRCKDALSFADEHRGFLGGWSAYQQPVIYRTADGGRTWLSSSPLADPPGFTTNFAGGGALRAGHVRAFGTELLVAAADTRERSYVFRSLDGGATWTYASTAPEFGGALTFVSASRWLQIAPTSSRETIDGGRTWRDFVSDYSQAAPVAPEVVFGDPLIGYATVRGGIRRTVDGGAHWSPIKTPGT